MLSSHLLRCYHPPHLHHNSSTKLSHLPGFSVFPLSLHLHSFCSVFKASPPPRRPYVGPLTIFFSHSSLSQMPFWAPRAAPEVCIYFQHSSANCLSLSLSPPLFLSTNPGTPLGQRPLLLGFPVSLESATPRQNRLAAQLNFIPGPCNLLHS